MRAREAMKVELEALRTEAQGLRDERDAKPRAAMDELVASDATAGPGLDLHEHEWEETRRHIEEIAGELGNKAREHPALSVAGAFALGVLLGRTLSR